MSADIKSRIDFLRQEINRHNYNYYVLALSEISDKEFDILLEELTKLEQAHPEFFDPNSPTLKVGGEINKNFETHFHKVPMLSLGNTYNEDELRDFDQRVAKGLGHNHYEYVCELKIDGVSISIIYQNGKLTKAVTRGDGQKGDLVTDNVKTIKNLPIQFSENIDEETEVRGEIFIHRKAFERMNDDRQKQGEELYANPRNVAAGTLKLQDSKEVSKRPLDVFIYQLASEKKEILTHFDSLNWIKKQGLPVNPYSQLCQNIDGVLNYIKTWDSKRKELSYDTDGVVIKVNDYQQREELGFTAKSPRWAIAYKFETEAAITQIVSIDYQVGRTGAITPVANLQPVLLLGTTVKRASLHNANEMERLEIAENDFVSIEKGGEIIPKITGVLKEKRSPDYKLISFPTLCPECQTPLIREEGEAQHYCPNESGCAPQVIGKIQHYTGRKAMDIQNLGDETVEMLFKAGLIQNIADIYSLNYNQLINLERLAEKSTLNLLEGIEKSKSQSFMRLLFGLGIRFVGETVAKKLCLHFKNIDNLQKASFEELIQVDEIGDRIAQSIINYFKEEKNLLLIEKLKEYGLKLQLDDSEIQHKASNKLEGKTFVVSGVFKLKSREELKQLIETHGGKNSGSISSKTHYVLAGDNMGPAKLEKAESLKIPIIGEEEFLNMVEG